MVNVFLKNICKSYDGSTRVLDRISIDIAAGELFFLLGPSGCGKSTLLRALAGFLAPDSGTIHFDDEDVTRQAAEKRETGMVFQSYALWPHMTVAENVAFGLDLRRVEAAERSRLVNEALDMVGLLELAGRRIPALSGGQQQRVALARAVVVRPRVLLLDEPLSNLDAKLRVAMRSEIRRICKEAGLTTIYVTHDQKEALSMADRLAVLHRGKLQQVAKPREVYGRPVNRFVADFIGECNFVDCEITGSAGAGAFTIRCAMGEFTSTAVAAGLGVGDRVVLVVRPEVIRFEAAPVTANGFSAALADRMYLGEIGQWSLTANGQSLKAFELHPLPRQTGETYPCSIAPDDLVVLAAE